MKSKARAFGAPGFSKVELLAIVMTVARVAGILLPGGISSARRKSARILLVAVMGIVALIFLPYIAQQRRPETGLRIKCVNNLKTRGWRF
ncbi:MAG: hypothetical protein ACXW3Z_16530 [Limisphaerales bacterium]